MFAGVGRSLIPILTPEYVVDETVKAVLVNQEMLCLPSIVYFLVMFKTIFPPKTFLWFHRAIGAASTMNTFKGRTVSGQVNQKLLTKETTDAHINIKMTPPDIGINIPEHPFKQQQQLNQ